MPWEVTLGVPRESNAQKRTAIAVRTRIGRIAKESAGRRGVAVSGVLPLTGDGRLNNAPKTLMMTMAPKYEYVNYFWPR